MAAKQKATGDKSWLFENNEKFQKSDCPKCNAISLIRGKIGSCFGNADKRFANHPNDEQRAKDVIRHCKENKVSKAELEEIILAFLYANMTNLKRMKENYEEAVSFLKKRLS